MNLRNALFNWAQIKLVADARPDDGAAKETVDFFETILREDHHVAEISMDSRDNGQLHLRFVIEGEEKTQMFDREEAERLLADIEANPKYN